MVVKANHTVKKMVWPDDGPHTQDETTAASAPAASGATSVAASPSHGYTASLATPMAVACDNDGEDDRSHLSAFWRIGPGRLWQRPGLRLDSGAPSDVEDTSGPETLVSPDGGDRADLSDFWRVGPGRNWARPS